MRADIKIQSVSDIITNSSSEVFCRIHSDDKKFMEELYDCLYTVYGWNQESEMTPVLDYGLDSSFDQWDYDSWEEEQKAREEAIDKTTITIEMPYSYRKILDYHKAGINAIIKKCKKRGTKVDVEFNEDF